MGDTAWFWALILSLEGRSMGVYCRCCLLWVGVSEWEMGEGLVSCGWTDGCTVDWVCVGLVGLMYACRGDSSSMAHGSCEMVYNGRARGYTEGIYHV